MSKELHIQQHANLFWYTPADKKTNISDALLVETILNYGTLDDYRALLTLFTPQRVAEVFFSADECQKSNYISVIRNFYSIVLRKYEC